MRGTLLNNYSLVSVVLTIVEVRAKHYFSCRFRIDLAASPLPFPRLAKGGGEISSAPWSIFPTSRYIRAGRTRTEFPVGIYVSRLRLAEIDCSYLAMIGVSRFY